MTCRFKKGQSPDLWGEEDTGKLSLTHGGADHHHLGGDDHHLPTQDPHHLLPLCQPQPQLACVILLVWTILSGYFTGLALEEAGIEVEDETVDIVVE